MATEPASPPIHQPTANPAVSVVVPVLNEQATVERLYQGITTTLDQAGISHEIIFVDDGSRDDTFATLARLHDADPRVRVVSFKQNAGQHPAMHAGMARSRGDIIVTMDGDLQNNPKDIPRLMAAIDAGADLASGRRETREDGFILRRIPSMMVNKMLRRLTRAPITDFGCAFNAYRRSALMPVLPRIGRQKFTKALVSTTTSRVVEVDVQHAARADKSRYSAIALAKMTLHVLTGFWPGLIQWVGTVVGIVGILASVVVTIWGIDVWIDHGNFPGPKFLGAVVLFMLGLQGFLLAAVGEYLQRIQRDVDGRPLYYIDRELG
jgi:undecaprenyl-phosphate 4-deoxy-4-formamido-L-arabinose transferase